MKIVLIFLTLTLSLFAVPINKTIDELLQENDMKVQKINKYDPFKRAKPLIKQKRKKLPQVKKIVKLEVVAIMDNKAFIDRTWVKKGDYVRGLKVVKITPLSVHLKNYKTTTILQLSKGKKLLSIHQKDKQ